MVGLPRGSVVASVLVSVMGASCVSRHPPQATAQPEQPQTSTRSEVEPFIGTWHGTAAIEIRKADGRPVDASSDADIVVEKIDDTSVTVKPDPKELPECRLTAKFDGRVMMLDPGQTCQRKKGVSMTLLRGSLEAEHGSLTIRIEMDVVEQLTGAMTTRVNMKTKMTGERVR